MEDVHLLLSQSDLKTQRHYTKNKQLEAEVAELKAAVYGGEELTKVIERKVREYIEKEREKEMEVRFHEKEEENKGT